MCVQDSTGESELDEAEKELLAAEMPAGNGDGKAKQRSGLSQLAQKLFSPVLVEAFVLTFLAEWGDRSQIATIGACFHNPPQVITFCNVHVVE